MTQQTQEPITYFGRKTRDITEEQKTFDLRLMRKLFRSGYYRGLTEGVLSSHVLMRLGEPPFQDALKRLVDAGQITITKQPWGNARQVELTADGRHWAELAAVEEA
jgi:hypothetical protein